MIHKFLGKYIFKFVVVFLITATLILSNSFDNTIARRYSFDMKEFLNGDHFIENNSELLVNSEIDIDILSEPKNIEDNYHNYKFTLNGSASHYAHKFHGRMTANGEIFNMNDYTCANKSLPFGTIMKITNTKNNKITFVRVNDRGPYVGGRIIDLSLKAAQEIDNLGIPTIKAEGFNRKKFSKSVTVEEDYFVGYSYNNNIICVPSSTVKVSYETKNFTDAVKQYKSLVKSSKIKNAFLFVSTQYSKKQKDTYIIGSIKSTPIIASN